MSNFLNIHVLISHSPSCLNRDDMNMQKSAIFGGKRRVRISSQSLKRAMRKSDYYAQFLGQPSIRTRNLGLISDELITHFSDDFDVDCIREAVDKFAKTTSKETDEDEQDEPSVEENTSNKKIAVAPWIVEEMRVVCAAVAKVRATGLSADEMANARSKFEKQKSKKKKDEQFFIEQVFAKKIDQEIANTCEAMNKCLNSAIDVALSGRMATSGLMTNIDGAMALAHTITTHAVDADIDWFTAVDDLNTEGSGHLDTQEFSSGVFYRYASLNIQQLQDNLGGATRERVLEIAAHLVHMLATVVPSAKQQSSAAHNLADLVMVSLSDMPISLANAFESPVTAKGNSGFLQPSINKLLEYWSKVHNGYGLDERTALFSLHETAPEAPKNCGNLKALETWVKGDGK